jgi:WD40 repeat protein
MFDDTRQREFSLQPLFRSAMKRRHRPPSFFIGSLIAGVLAAGVANAQAPIEFKGHEEVVYDAKFLPDGKSLVTASFDQTLKLWDVATQSTLRTMEGHTGIVLTVDVSADGKMIASGSSDRTIRLWDVPNSDPISTNKVHDAAVTSMATSKDGSLTATGDDKGLIRVSVNASADDASAEAPPTQPKPTREIAIGRAITRLAWKADNKTLAAACADGSVVVVSLAADGTSETMRLIAHDGEVTGVGFTPNNQYIFSCGADGYVRRWPTTIPQTLTFEGLAKAATAVALHPNGSLIAVVGQDGIAKILKRADGAVVHTLEGHSGAVTGVAFNRAGNQVATLGSDQIVRVFDVSTGKSVLSTVPAKSPLTAIVFSADGKDVIVGTEGGDILAHAFAEPVRFRSLSKRPKPVRAVATTSDGARLLFAGDDQQIWIRDSATEKTERGVGFDAAVTAIAISSNNAAFAVGLASGATITVDAKSLEQTIQLAGHKSPVRKVAFNTSGTQLVSSSTDGVTRLWDLKAQAIAQSFRDESNSIVDVAFQNDNKSIVTAHADGKVLIETIAAQIVHRADDGRVNDISIAANGSQYATAGADGTVKLWNASNSSPTRSFTGFEGPALCVSLSPDNRQVAAGGSDKTVRTWNVGNASGHFRLNVPVEARRVSYSPDSSRLIAALVDKTLQCFDPTPLNPQPAEPPARDASQLLRGHTGPIGDIAWAPDSQSLRSCSADMTLREWSIASPKEKKRFSGHALDVYSVVFSPDGETLASASADKTVRLWSLETGKAIKTLASFPAAVYGLDFSSDGKQIAIAGADNTVRILDVGNGREVRQFNGPTHAVYTVAFSPDDSQIAAAGMGLGSERNIYLWSTDSSDPTSVLTGHTDDIYRTQFNSTGSRLLSIGYSGSLRIWDVTSGKSLLESNQGVVSYSVNYSPDGSKVVVTSNDRTARLIAVPDSAR